jgi:hypothetical protein
MYTVNDVLRLPDFVSEHCVQVKARKKGTTSSELFLQATKQRWNDEGKVPEGTKIPQKNVPTTKRIRGATCAAARTSTSSTHQNLSPLLKLTFAKLNQHSNNGPITSSLNAFVYIRFSEQS